MGTESWQGSTFFTDMFLETVVAAASNTEVTAAQAAPTWERTVKCRDLSQDTYSFTYKCCSNKRQGLVSGVWARQ